MSTLNLLSSRHGHGSRTGGFTLIELVVAIAILAIIVAVAIPAYTEYTVRANRTDGKTALMNTANALERCYTRFSSYNNAACTVTLDFTSEGEWYQIDGVVTATTYALTAAPLAAQATRDTRCATLSLNHTGVRGVSGTGDPSDCW